MCLSSCSNGDMCNVWQQLVEPCKLLFRVFTLTALDLLMYGVPTRWSLLKWICYVFRLLQSTY